MQHGLNLLICIPDDYISYYAGYKVKLNEEHVKRNVVLVHLNISRAVLKTVRMSFSIYDIMCQ